MRSFSLSGIAPRTNAASRFNPMRAVYPRWYARVVADRPRAWKLPRTVVSLGFVSLANDIASEMIYPLLPAFLAVTLGAGPAAIGIVEGIAEATAAVGKGFFGWLADRSRRSKGFVLAGYAVSTAVRPLIALARAWPAVAAIRFADRAGKGIRSAPRDRMVAAAVPAGRRGRAFGFERAMDNLGALLGPVAATILLKVAGLDIRMVFALTLVPGLATVAILLFATPEPAETPSPAETSSKRGPLPRGLAAVIAAVAVFSLANSTDAFLLLRARECGIPIWALPLLWAGFNGARAAANTPLGALADRVGSGRTLVAGWMLYAATYFAFGRVTGPLAVGAAFLSYALYYAFSEGAERALVADLAPAESRGRAFGAFYMISGLSALPASLLFGALWSRFGSRTAFDIGAIFALAASAGLALALRTRGK